MKGHVLETYPQAKKDPDGKISKKIVKLMFKLYIRLELIKISDRAADSEDVRVKATVRLFAAFGGAVFPTDQFTARTACLAQPHGWAFIAALLLPFFCLTAALLISCGCLGLPCRLPYCNLQDLEAVL